MNQVFVLYRVCFTALVGALLSCCALSFAVEQLRPRRRLSESKRVMWAPPAVAPRLLPSLERVNIRPAGPDDRIDGPTRCLSQDAKGGGSWLRPTCI